MTAERLTGRQHDSAVHAPDPALPLTALEPIADISRRHPHEWLLIKLGNPGAPPRMQQGELLVHSPSREKIAEARVAAHRKDPGMCTLVLHGGPMAFSMDELPQLIEEARALYPDADW